MVDIEPTVVEYTDYNDPLIGVNRAVFAFNDVTYRYLLIPASKGYVAAVPAPARQSVSNFFYNLKTPIYLVGNLLQLDFGAAGDNLVRFGMNTTTGVLGLFDTADAWLGVERAEAHLEDALISYGAGYGIYVVIPFLGPSDLRNAPSELADMVLNPVFHLTENPERLMIQSFDYLQENAAGADRYSTLREKSEDPYIYFRNMYLQGVQRDADYQ
ncbi:MlaA family lipoprotein [Marinimicrobium agarilyticum]|uniref:MlaA family lipoprotein n=1 Tax=Marinimicrobium agarilyticum TaxID=306546 RepID=UPI00146CC42E|nr:VacJ family lipoprotein [Marinimicrobium agarilyticum]